MRLKNNRNQIVDILKGLAIITVILVHVFRGKGPLDVFIGEISRWAVPCFFMIQGYFMVKSGSKPWALNLKQKILNVYIPFLLFSVAYGFYFLKVDKREFSLVDVFMGETAIHLYFMLHYMVFAVFVPLMYRLSRGARKTLLWTMVASNFLLCLSLELQRRYGLRLIDYNGFNPAKYWGFIALGMLASENGKLLDYLKQNRRSSMWIFAIVSVIGIIQPYLTDTLGYIYNRSSLFPLAIGATLFFATYFQAEVRGKDALGYIGRNSFGIYLVHLFVVNILKYRIGIGSNWTIAVMTLGICIGLVELYKRLNIRFDIN